MKNWLLRRCACYGNRELHDAYIPDDDDNDDDGNDQDDDGDVKGHCCTAGRGVAGGAAGSQVLQLGLIMLRIKMITMNLIKMIVNTMLCIKMITMFLIKMIAIMMLLIKMIIDDNIASDQGDRDHDASHQDDQNTERFSGMC